MLAPGLDDGPRRATGAVLIDDLGGGSAELLHPLWVKGSVGFLGIPGVDGACVRPTPEGYLCREWLRPLASAAAAAHA
jgi:hypothetical protein